MLLLLLLGLREPIITDAPVLKRKTSIWQMDKITDLQKTKKEQQGFGAPHYSGCI